MERLIIKIKSLKITTQILRIISSFNDVLSHHSIYIFCSLLLLNFGCFRKNAGSKVDEYVVKQPTEQKFAYVFERKGRRNPYIGVGILPEKKKDTNKIDEKNMKGPPPQENKEASNIIPQTTRPINKWPGDENTTKILKETYSKLDMVAGHMYESIIDSFEHIDEISDDEFVSTFTNIYILYRLYYQSKRGENLKKYTNTLKSYIESIEKMVNPVKYIYEYLEELFTILRNDFVKAQNKPSLFEDLKDDMRYANKLLHSPLLVIRKKKFIEDIEKINKQTRKKYEALNRALNTYVDLYKEFKNSRVSISGYVYSKDKPEENVIFVADGMKKNGDTLWGDVKILGIGKGEVEVLYKGEKVILHFLEE